MRRLAAVGWLLAVLIVTAIALEPVSQPASIALAALAALLGMGVALGAVGGSEPYVDRGRESAEPHTLARKRGALGLLARKRDWDRRAPDAPDEPADAIWERERRRRGIGPTG